MAFKSKYCKQEMVVTSVEYQSNKYCNFCFEERADSLNIKKEELNTISFMGYDFSRKKMGKAK